MADETFHIKVAIDPTGAVAGGRPVITVLQSIDAAANRTRNNLDNLWPSGRGASREAEALTRQKRLLESIRKPAHDYAMDLRALEKLHQRGAITAQEYSQQLKKLEMEYRRASSAAKGGAGGGGGTLSSIMGARGKLVGAAAAVTGAAFSAKAVTDLADEYTNLQNRLRTVTNGAEDLAKVQAELFKISQGSRAGLKETAELYVRIAANARELGLGTRSVLDFTESLNKAVKLSGAGGREANAAIIQLSQGLASGTLRGDELRSVLEQLPTVADVIAKGLGVTRGELRKMGEDGKISARAVIDAFAKAREEINEKFAKSIPTVGDAFTVMKNQILVTVGSMLQFIGPTVFKMAEAFNAALEKLKPLGDALGEFVATVGDLVAKNVVQFFDAMVNSMTPVIKLLEQGNLLFGGFLDGFDKILGKKGAASDVLFSSSFINLLASADDKSEAARLQKEKAEKLRVEGERALEQALVKERDRQTAVDKVAAKALGDAFGKDIRKIHKDLEEANKKAKIAAREHAKEQERLANSFQSLVGQVYPVEAAYGELQKAVDLVNHAEQKLGLSEELGAQILERRKEQLKAALDPITAVANAIHRETELAKLSNEERARAIRLQEIDNQIKAQGVDLSQAQLSAFDTLLDAQEDAERVQARRQAQMDREKQILAEINGPQNEYRANVDALNSLYESGQITQEQYVQQLERMQAAFGDMKMPHDEFMSWEAAVSDGFSRIKNEALDFGKTLSDTIVNAFHGVENAIVDLVTTGKTDFKAMVDGMLGDMTRLILRMLLARALVSSFGGGALGAGGAGLLGFATGGSFRVGGAGGTDSQLVAFRATPGERVDVSTPNQQRRGTPGGSSGGGGGDNRVYIINHVDPSQAVSALSTPKGRRTVRNEIVANRRMLGRVLR